MLRLTGLSFFYHQIERIASQPLIDFNAGKQIFHKLGKVAILFLHQFANSPRSLVVTTHIASTRQTKQPLEPIHAILQKSLVFGIL